MRRRERVWADLGTEAGGATPRVGHDEIILQEVHTHRQEVFREVHIQYTDSKSVTDEWSLAPAVVRCPRAFRDLCCRGLGIG